MGNMLVRLQVSLKHETEAHSIATSLSRVDWSLDSATKFELVSFNGHDLHERHIFNELFGNLVIEASLVNVPSGAFNEEALDVGTVLELLRDLASITFTRHNCIQGGFIQSPTLVSTGGLH